MLWMVVAALAALAAAGVFMIAPAPGAKRRRAPFAGRNFAHRGLFDPAQTTPENSLPAFDAAACAGYGIELDVQLTKDGQVVVFHDDTVDRMTTARGWVRDFTYAQLCALPLAGSACYAPTLAQTLQTVAGRVPLIIEIKSRHEYKTAYLDTLCTAVLTVLQGYEGDYCIESFDPRVVRRIRKSAPGVLRGQLVDSARAYRAQGAKWYEAFVISHCLGNFLGRPNFIAWCPEKRNTAIRLCAALGAMMVYWTAQPHDDPQRLQQHYDAVIFQWYRPPVSYRRTQLK